MTVGVMSVGEITVGVMTVGVMTVGVMRRPPILHIFCYIENRVEGDTGYCGCLHGSWLR